MIRCVRLWTGGDDASHVQIGRLDMQPGRNADLVSAAMPTTHVTVEEIAALDSASYTDGFSGLSRSSSTTTLRFRSPRAKPATTGRCPPTPC